MRHCTPQLLHVQISASRRRRSASSFLRARASSCSSFFFCFAACSASLAAFLRPRSARRSSLAFFSRSAASCRCSASASRSSAVTRWLLEATTFRFLDSLAVLCAVITSNVSERASWAVSLAAGICASTSFGEKFPRMPQDGIGIER